MDPLDAQVRQVFFFDTPDLALDGAGVVAARRVQGKGDDTVVKLRPVVPDELPAKLRASAMFGVEVDAMPGLCLCSGSLGVPKERDAVKATVAGERPCASCSARSSALFEEHALQRHARTSPCSARSALAEDVAEDARPQAGRRAVVHPDGARILELLTKCAPDEARSRRPPDQGSSPSEGTDLSKQQTKTRTALNFYLKELKAAAA